MSSKRYTTDFRAEAVHQVTERRYPVREVAGRLVVSTHSVYKWLKEAGKTPRLVVQEDLRAEHEENPGVLPGQRRRVREPSSPSGSSGRRRALWRTSSGPSHAHPRHSGDPGAQEAPVQVWQACGCRSEPTRTEFFRGRTGSGLGHGYHLYPGLRGVALSGGGRGSLLPDRRRLVDEAQVDTRTGPGCYSYGRLAPSSQAAGLWRNRFSAV